jgi:hypothetical protein
MLDVLSNQLNMKRFQGVLAGNICECSLKLSIGNPEECPSHYCAARMLTLLGFVY